MQYVIKLNEITLFTRRAYEVELFFTNDGDNLSRVDPDKDHYFKDLDEALSCAAATLG